MRSDGHGHASGQDQGREQADQESGRPSRRVLPCAFPAVITWASAVLLADVLHVVQPGAEGTAGLSGVAAAGEGAEALLVFFAETGGTDGQEAEDEEHVQHQCRRPG